MIQFTHILVATDFSDGSQLAVSAASDLAMKYGSHLTLLHTWEVPVYPYDGMSSFIGTTMFAPIQNAAKAQLESTLRDLKMLIPRAESVLRMGKAADEIVQAVQDIGCDLVVMGTHGRRGFGHFMIGSVAEHVVRTSPVPVLTVRLNVAAH